MIIFGIHIGRRTPADEAKELLELIVKAGRRCAYDLLHAADEIRDRRTSDGFRERGEMWLTVFNPDNGPKDYRAELHREIMLLEGKVRRLERLCEEKGIDHEDPDGIPF